MGPWVRPGLRVTFPQSVEAALLVGTTQGLALTHGWSSETAVTAWTHWLLSGPELSEAAHAMLWPEIPAPHRRRYAAALLRVGSRELRVRLLRDLGAAEAEPAPPGQLGRVA